MGTSAESICCAQTPGETCITGKAEFKIIVLSKESLEIAAMHDHYRDYGIERFPGEIQTYNFTPIGLMQGKQILMKLIGIEKSRFKRCIKNTQGL